MRNIQIALLLFVCLGSSTALKSQNLKKGYLEQGFEYYFATKQYDKALKALENLQKGHDLHSVKLDFALDVAVKFKRDELIVALLEEDFSDFNADIPHTEAFIGEWLGDTTFSFAKHFWKKWPAVSKSLELKQEHYEDNLKSEYYSTLQNFLSVDQFVRFNDVSLGTFNEVDSINLDLFCNWLIEYPGKDHLKSRANNQALIVLLRHIGPKRLALLEEHKVFSTLLAQEILSAQDYGLMYDYANLNPVYFIQIDGFIEKSWDKSGIKTKAELQAVDKHRQSIGLLPLEYSGFCLQRGIAAPAELKYAKAADELIFGAH